MGPLLLPAAQPRPPKRARPRALRRSPGKAHGPRGARLRRGFPPRQRLHHQRRAPAHTPSSRTVPARSALTFPCLGRHALPSSYDATSALRRAPSAAQGALTGRCASGASSSGAASTPTGTTWRPSGRWRPTRTGTTSPRGATTTRRWSGAWTTRAPGGSWRANPAPGGRIPLPAASFATVLSPKNGA